MPVEQTEIMIDEEHGYYEVSKGLVGKKLKKAEITLNDCLACSYVLSIGGEGEELISPLQWMHHVCRIGARFYAISRGSISRAGGAEGASLLISPGRRQLMQPLAGAPPYIIRLPSEPCQSSSSA